MFKNWFHYQLPFHGLLNESPSFCLGNLFHFHFYQSSIPSCSLAFFVLGFLHTLIVSYLAFFLLFTKCQYSLKIQCSKLFFSLHCVFRPFHFRLTWTTSKHVCLLSALYLSSRIDLQTPYRSSSSGRLPKGSTHLVCTKVILGEEKCLLLTHHWVFGLVPITDSSE